MLVIRFGKWDHKATEDYYYDRIILSIPTPYANNKTCWSSSRKQVRLPFCMKNKRRVAPAVVAKTVK